MLIKYDTDEIEYKQISEKEFTKRQIIFKVGAKKNILEIIHEKPKNKSRVV